MSNQWDYTLKMLFQASPQAFLDLFMKGLTYCT